jgi:hypothetical protein
MATSGRGITTDANIINLILGAAAYAAPAGCYAALFSAVGTADYPLTAFTELTGSGYTRATVSTTNASTAWTAAVNDATGSWKQNNVQISFPTATAGWSPATGYGIYDAATAGTLLYWGTFGSATTVGSGATASFAVNALKITEA